MRLSRPMQDALSDMHDGRVIIQAVSDWGGLLDPREIPEKRCRTFLGNVKTATIKALLKRGLIREREKLSYADLYVNRIPRVYVLCSTDPPVASSPPSSHTPHPEDPPSRY